MTPQLATKRKYADADEPEKMASPMKKQRESAMNMETDMGTNET
jgi:hypothetical protein